MKKSIILIFLLLVLVTGCGKKNRVICNGTVIDDGLEMKTEVIGDFDKDDKLYYVTVIYDFGKEELANNYCNLLKKYSSTTMKINYECKGTKATIKDFIEFNASTGEDNMTGISKMEFEKNMEESLSGNFSCKHEE